MGPSRFKKPGLLPWRCRLICSVAGTVLVLLVLSNRWVNALTWGHNVEATLQDTVQTLTASRSLLRSYEAADELPFGPPSRKEAWECPPAQAAVSQRVGLDPEKYLLLGQINEQLTKSTRHLGEYMVLARALNRTLVLPDVGENEIGMQRSKPFCLYFDTNLLGNYVDWITPEQFLYNTRSKLNDNVQMSEIKTLLDDTRSKAVRFAFDVEWQRPESLPLGEYDWLEEGVLETDQRLGSNKPSAGALVLKRVEDFCGLRVKPFLWFRVQQMVDMETVICAKEPPFGAPGALNRSLNEIVDKAQKHLGELDVVVGIKNRAYNLFLPKEVVKEALRFVRPAPQILENAARLKGWLGERYVAVQWRIEKCLERDECDTKVLQTCAQGLVSTVKRKLASLQATRVFFASDAPSKDGTLRSFSYMKLKDPQKRMKMAQDAASYVLENLEAVTWEMFDRTVLSVDAGIQAMLDKDICVNAEAFIIAPDECIGTPSEYAISIGKARVDAGKAVGMEAWNLNASQTR